MFSSSVLASYKATNEKDDNEGKRHSTNRYDNDEPPRIISGSCTRKLSKY